MSSKNTNEMLDNSITDLEAHRMLERLRQGNHGEIGEEPKMKSHQALTALTQKQHSPLVIRKVTKYGFPIYVGIIADANLDCLDVLIKNFIEGNMPMWESNSIQEKRNLAGMLSDHIGRTIPNVEGIAVTFYIDKMVVSSLHGDFMNHFQCKFEYYTLLNMSTNV